MLKFGKGEIIPEEGDDKKTAKKHFTEEDREALEKENEEG